MRSGLGFLVLNGAFVAVGLGVLAAAGVVPLRVRALLPALGAALLTGAALVGSLGVALLTAGVELTLPIVALVVIVLCALLGALAWWRRDRAAAAADDAATPPASPADRMLSRAMAVGVGVFVLVQVVSSRHTRAAWDAEHVWALKATALTTGGLQGELFTGGHLFFGAHLTYPVLQPVVGSLLFRLGGTGNAGLIVSELWVLAGALVLAAPMLCGRRSPAWLAALPVALVLATAPTAGLLRGDADVLMAVFVAFGAMALARWVAGGPGGLAVVAALALGAAANTKDEGQAFALAVLAAAGVVLLAGERRRLPALLAVVAGAVVVAAPWQLWLHANGPFSSDVTPASTWLSLSFLSDHLVQLDHGAQAMLGAYADSVGEQWLIPAFLAVALAAVVLGRERRVAVLYVVATLLCTLFVLWAYWTYDNPDWAGHIDRTIIRTVTGPLFLAAAGLSDLLARTADRLAVLRR